LENSAKNNCAEFSTVSTAPTAGYCLEEKENRACWKAKSNSIGQDAFRSVKTFSPGDTPLAGFDPTTYGRF
jgi:hypothetical protein